MPFTPLAGVRVLDLTSSLAGPWCTQTLAALGADVVKVERPAGGDEARAWGPPFWEGSSVIFFTANAGKRSVALDLGAEEGREALLRLVPRADVLVQSLRPGAAERLGLSAVEVTARNAALVYCSIGAFGRVGPLRSQPGYDPLMQAAAGLMSVTGEPDRPGVRSGASIVDLATGTWAALAVVAALLERGRTGRGAVLDLSLYESALALLPYQLADYAATGRVSERRGSAFPLIVPYEVFATADRELMVVAGNDRLFAALCQALGLPELAGDPRFETNPLRVQHRDELLPPIRARLRQRPAAEWVELLARAGVPASPVHDVGEAAEHAQTKALDVFQPLDGLLSPASPLSVDGERVRHRSRPPRLGEHTAEVLAEAGYSEAEVAELTAAGVARVGGNGPAR